MIALANMTQHNSVLKQLFLEQRLYNHSVVLTTLGHNSAPMAVSTTMVPIRHCNKLQYWTEIWLDLPPTKKASPLALAQGVGVEEESDQAQVLHFRKIKRRNMNRGVYRVEKLALLMGVHSFLRQQPNKSPLAAMACLPHYDGNVWSNVFDMAYHDSPCVVDPFEDPTNEMVRYEYPTSPQVVSYVCT